MNRLTNAKELSSCIDYVSLMNHGISGLRAPGPETRSFLFGEKAIEFTKSRALHTNDRALVKGKNGSIIRKHMGHWHIPQSGPAKIQSFYKETFNEYLNFHHACGFATETMDEKGEFKKRYEDYLTPFEKLQSLPKPEQFLKEGVTMESLEEVEQQRSDIKYAKLVQEKKMALSRSFSKPGILT